MKFRFGLILLSTVVFIAACKKGGGAHSDATDDVDISTPSHKPSECPEVSGEYMIKSQSRKKSIRSQSSPTGLIFEDTEQKWSIDGIRHIWDAQPNLKYRGYCSQYKIFIHFFERGRQLAQSEYSWNRRGQLTIKRTSNDAHFGESGVEVWDENQE